MPSGTKSQKTSIMRPVRLLTEHSSFWWWLYLNKDYKFDWCVPAEHSLNPIDKLGSFLFQSPNSLLSLMD
jgi:hypothetical protein